MIRDEKAFRKAVLRAKNGGYREYWLQKYIKDNYKDLGFESIEGPFDFGYDFKGIYQGKPVVVEAERALHSFIQHKHNHKEADILITLNADYIYTVRGIKPTEWRKLLPKKIIIVDPEDFIKKTHEMRKAYAIKKKTEIRAKQDLFPFFGIKRSFWILWELFNDEIVSEGSLEEDHLSETIEMVTLIYFEENNLNIKEMVEKNLFSKIQIITNDLVKSRRDINELSEEEKQHLDYWLELIRLEYISKF